MTDAQTEARAIAQTSLWIPAKPEHAKIGWTYDFEQTERIARAAYDSTGYDATMEVVEFVMAEADRRHRDALAAKDAELALETAKCEFWRKADATSQSQLAEARKALEGQQPVQRKFKLGDRVTKTKGSSWQGRVVGFYSTVLTQVGYAVESERERGSVQIYPEAALKLIGPAPHREGEDSAEVYQQALERIANASARGWNVETATEALNTARAIAATALAATRSGSATSPKGCAE